MDPSLLTTCRGMLMQATQLGERPLAYIMNPATQQHMTDLAAVEAMPKQLAFQRVLFRARKKHLILQVFCGVPILQNQFMPDGFVSLQFIPRGPQMQQGAAMPAGAPSVQAQANSAPGEWPFAKKQELRIQEAPADLDPGCLMRGTPGADGLCPVSAKCASCDHERARNTPTLDDLHQEHGRHADRRRRADEGV